MKTIKRTMVFLFSGMLLLMLCSICNSCSDDGTNDTTDPAATLVVDVDPSLFLADGLVEPITTEERTLSDGTVATCYKITTTSTPSDHTMGPWCPANIADGADQGGKWFEDGEIYDVDGPFIENLATFYSDATWKVYDENGDIYVTATLEDCQAAANPNVGEEYQNYCVECQPSYVTDITLTYYIPVTPVKLDSPDPTMDVGPGSVVGVALNGVNFDPPAPTNQILAAYTVAPMDDNGGHVNPNTGYHYHAATGMTTSIAQDDGHAGMIGYAMDGFAIYELLDADGNETADLDECRGHTDDTRGYHYHVAYAGTNSFIGCFSGAQGSFEAN